MTASGTDTTTTRSLIHRALSYACGDGASALVNVLTFTLLLRYLSAREFGYLSVGQALSTWIQPVLYMGANFEAVRLIAANPRHTKIIARRMFAVRFAAGLAVSVCTAAFALSISDRAFTSVLLAYAFLFLFYPAQPDFIAIGLHRARVYTGSRWIASACFLVVIALLLTRVSLHTWMVPVAYAAALALSAGYGLRALWHPLRTSNEGDEVTVALLLRGAAIVVAAQFLQMGQASLDIILLKAWGVHVDVIGDYGAISRLTTAVCLPFTALIYSLAPIYVKQLAGRDMARVRELEWRFRMCLLAAGIAGALAIVTVGPRALQLVSGRPIPSAHQLAPVFALICIAVALHNSYTAMLVYGGATHLYLVTYAAGLATTLIAGIALIPRFVTLGAALSELAGFVVILAVSRSIVVRRQNTGGHVLVDPAVQPASGYDG